MVTVRSDQSHCGAHRGLHFWRSAPLRTTRIRPQPRSVWTLVDVAPGSRRSSMTSTAATPLPWQDHELQLVLDALDRLAASLTPAPMWAPSIGEYLGTAFTGWRTLSNTPDDDRIDPPGPGRGSPTWRHWKQPG